MSIYYNFRSSFETLYGRLGTIVDELDKRRFLTKQVLVAHDGLAASKAIADRLALLLRPGHDPVLGGTSSTAAAAYYCARGHISGFMVTASHCSDTLSGLKVFDDSGYIISVEEERSVTDRVRKAAPDAFPDLIPPAGACADGEVRLCDSVHGEYIRALRRLRDSIGGRVCWVVFGETAGFVKALLAGSGDRFIESDGADPENRAAVPPPEFRYTVSLDADMDKCVLYRDGLRVNENEIIRGLALACGAKEVITNHEAHPDLESALGLKGIRCRRVRVGDQYIIDCLRNDEGRANVLGAEPNGHYILPGTPGPDAVMAALRFIAWDGAAAGPSARYPFSKAVLVYPDEKSRLEDYRRVRARGVAVWEAEDETLFSLGGGLCYMRISMWEGSLVVICFGGGCDRALSALCGSMAGRMTRRIDYVEV